MDEGTAAVQALPSPEKPIAAAQGLIQGFPRTPVICAHQAGPPDHARPRLLIRSKAARPPFPLRSLLWELSTSRGRLRGPPASASLSVLPVCDVGHFCAHLVPPPPSRGPLLHGARSLDGHLDLWPDHAP
ncbi:hypothetical protein NDU88_004613 [Pleurodeles waltl]|uniref:Uncharacterized protein n=1 Tax=Pleurodeles waltl TaxID=8319 RepID=A0AAV7WW07_PLEWA|nr:hypothetical protein NDU88_004613 [Pleurodeles waltl]